MAWPLEFASLVWSGHLDEARELLADPTKCPPYPWSFREPYVDALLVLGDRERAARGVSKTPEQGGIVHPGWAVRWLRALGRDDDALELAKLLASGEGEACVDRAYALAVAGDPEGARRDIEARERLWTPFDALERARVYAVFGETNQAREWLDRAEALGIRIPDGAAPDRDLEPIRSSSPTGRAKAE